MVKLITKDRGLVDFVVPRWGHHPRNPGGILGMASDA